MRAFLRRQGFGRLWYKHYHARLERFRWRQQFGPNMALPMTLGEWRMILRARWLPRIPSPPATAPTLACSFMTGRRFWYQTAFCAHSLAREWTGSFCPTFCDDGTLRRSQAATLQRIFPAAKIIWSASTRERLDQCLPANRFPLLRALRDEIPMMRKLIDLRAPSREWQLYLDSDMLFFRRPGLLFDWARRRSAFCMQDTVHGYCAAPDRVSTIMERAVIPGVNAGVFAFDDAQIDWDRIEHWCGRFSPEERRHILFEQTLSAALLSGVEHQQLPVSDYVVLYQPVEPPASATLLHYVHRAKSMYFIREWRRYLQSEGPVPASAGAKQAAQ